METKRITIAETFRFPGTDIILEKGDVIEVPVEEAVPEKRCECGQLLTGEAKLCEVCAANNERNEDAVILPEISEAIDTAGWEQAVDTITGAGVTSIWNSDTKRWRKVKFVSGGKSARHSRLPSDYIMYVNFGGSNEWLLNCMGFKSYDPEQMELVMIDATYKFK